MVGQVTIDQFQGPLDLLLSLITAQKIDILDIPIAKITDQYRAIIEGWQVYDMEEASDYIVMAARLVEIKSKMLLPRRKVELQEDPREELAAQLAQYAVYKRIAEYLEQLEGESAQALSKDPEYIPGDVPDPPPAITLSRLERAMRRVLAGLEARKPPTLPQGAEEYSVDAQRELITSTLMPGESKSIRVFLSGRPSVEEVVATFLAVLELYKVGEVDFSQDEREIFVFRPN